MSPSLTGLFAPITLGWAPALLQWPSPPPGSLGINSSSCLLPPSGVCALFSAVALVLKVPGEEQPVLGLVCSGRRSLKAHRWGGLNNRNTFPHSSGLGSKVRALAGVLSPGACLLDLPVTDRLLPVSWACLCPSTPSHKDTSHPGSGFTAVTSL